MNPAECQEKINNIRAGMMEVFAKEVGTWTYTTPTFDEKQGFIERVKNLSDDLNRVYEFFENAMGGTNEKEIN